MKTIQIFLASSEELEVERYIFGNLVRKLDYIYEKRGIRVKLFEWEDYDAAYNDRRKQDEYNDKVRASDMFIAIFHTKAGKFTIEEFDVATEEFRKHATPKIYTYFKELKPGEKESKDLLNFKKRLFEEMGYYWSRFYNRDSLQLHFVMQLQLVEKSGIVEKLKLKDGTVVLEDMPIAKIDNLLFASDNVAYKKMRAELAELPKRIERAQMRVDRYPNDKDLCIDLQQMQNHYNELKEEFSRLQKALFDTAQRISILQLEVVSSEMRRAINEFETGHVEAANAILDGIKNQIKQHKEQAKLNHEIIHQDIQALELQTKSLMVDARFPIGERIKRTLETYKEADELASLSALEPKKYSDLLFDYALFLQDYAYYNDAESIYHRQIQICTNLYGDDSPEVTCSYNNLGMLHHTQGNYEEALSFYIKALEIEEKTHGLENPTTSDFYNNIGGIYHLQNNYTEALRFYSKALVIKEKEVGKEHPSTATFYHNIGGVYYSKKEYKKALEYFLNALKINEKEPGFDVLINAYSYYCIGCTYQELKEYPDAVDYLLKSKNIREKKLGYGHPDTVSSYIKLGDAYVAMTDFINALKYHKTAMTVREIYDSNSSDTAKSYINVALDYYKLNNYQEALKYDLLAIQNLEAIKDTDKLELATLYYVVGELYHYKLNDYSSALDFYFKTITTREALLGRNHPDTVLCYDTIGWAYFKFGDYQKALDYFYKELNYFKTINADHPEAFATMLKINYIKQIKDKRGSLHF